MKFVTSESIVQTGNEKLKITELSSGYHLLSYVDGDYKLSEVVSVLEVIITENREVVCIDSLDVCFSSNHPIIVKNLDDTISIAAFNPDNVEITKFSLDNHRVFNGLDWVKIENYKTINYTGFGYDLTSKDDNYFLNSLLMSN